MKLLLLILTSLTYLNSCSQKRQNSEPYNTENYTLSDSLSVDKSGYFLKIYTNNLDSSLKLLEYYIDMERKIIVIKSFSNDGLNDGPIIYYNNFFPDTTGKIGTTGFYRKGKKDGEWKDYYYQTGSIEKIYFYKDGKESGTWKFYDQSGKFIKQEEWDVQRD